MCHREKEFSDLLNNLNNNILDLFELRNKEAYYPVIITGSSTAANEAVISSVSGDKNILILANGEFGDRLHKITSIHTDKTHLLNFGWTNKIDVKKVEQYVKKYRIGVIAMAHHETSTGMLNPVEEVGQIAHKYGAIYFVDAVSSIGADAIDVEKSHITFCTTASGKAVGSFPGTSIVLGKVADFEKLGQHAPRTAYLNLFNFYRFSYDRLQTPNTPNVPGFRALNQAIRNILNEGPAKRRAKVRSYAQQFRTALKKLDVEFCIDESDMSNVLTTVYAPVHMTVDELQEKLRARRIIIYSAKGPLIDKAFQIANIGDITKEDVQYVIRALKDILKPQKSFSTSSSMPQFGPLETDPLATYVSPA
jgi:2-aminoethylphosphonate-pyruvate transaminase